MRNDIHGSPFLDKNQASPILIKSLHIVEELNISPELVGTRVRIREHMYDYEARDDPLKDMEVNEVVDTVLASLDERF